MAKAKKKKQSCEGKKFTSSISFPVQIHEKPISSRDLITNKNYSFLNNDGFFFNFFFTNVLHLILRIHAKTESMFNTLKEDKKNRHLTK